MQFTTMQSELSDRLGVIDNSQFADRVKMQRWLNIAYQYICGKANWPFLQAYEIVQTVADITTGTVSATSESTSITFSSAPSVSVANRYIQFSSADDWYKITAHTASSTSATISPAYGQSSNLSAGTYKVRKLLYSTTTPLVSCLDIKKTVNPGRLESLNQREGDFFLPLYLETGDPTGYIAGPPDSTGGFQFSLANPPSSVFNMHIRGIKVITEMSEESDVPIFPARWHSACVDIAAYYGFQTIDDTRAAESLAVGEVKIQDMLRTFSPDLGRHRVMSSVDSDFDSGPVFQLPGDYGRMYY